MFDQIFNKLNKRHYAMVKIIMLIRLLLGLYSKIQNCFAFVVVAKAYCFIYITVFIYICTTYWSDIIVNETSASVVLINMIFISSVILSLLTDGEHLFHYIQELDKVDPLALVTVETYQVPVSFATFIFVFVANINGYVTMLSLDVFNSRFVTINFVVSLTAHISHMTRILVFEILWTRVKSLGKSIDKWSAINDADDDQVKWLSKNLKEYVFIYRNILQCNKIIGHSTKFLMLLFLTAAFICVLDVADVISKKGTSWNIVYVLVVGTVVEFATFCIPALFGELVNAEVENMRNNLARQFKSCHNNALRNQILKAIKYIDLCPIKFTVWRLFSVDSSLSLALFNLCTTYTIVLLQFKQVKI